MNIKTNLTYKTGILLAFTFFLSLTAFAQNEALKKKIQATLDSLCKTGKFPGLNAGVVLPDNTVMGFASGMADSVHHIPMTPESYMMQGSVGKTYVSAIAMLLVKEGKFSLNDKVSKYLGHYEWYSKLPNAPDITIRMLMNHTSGIMRYELKDEFTRDLTANPAKVWKPEEELSYVFNEKPGFKAGEGWDYADTNYIILAMIMEQVTGEKYYDMLRKRILKPYHLAETLPSDKRKLKGLVQGYAGDDNPFGGKPEVIADNGEFIINPQFEWTGGGIYSTSRDLAKWGKMLYEGKVFDPAMLHVMEDDAVLAPMLGKTTKYGLGVIVRESPKFGTYYGHSGFFPGYMTEMCYFPRYQMAFAIQTNSSDFKSLKVYLLRALLDIANAAFEEQQHAK